MEKAMQKSHGIGYEEYGRRLSKRMEVERQRELEYQKASSSRPRLNEKIGQ
ncbi:hypothetical protein KQR56_04820 [Bacillus velezensis]|nr:hypothetical protein [Bacillus velezensis]